MKTKKLFLMAAMLLTSVCTFAQNNTSLKGDVNEDGTVDVADLVSIMKIMKDAGGAVGEKMYYWYAGVNGGNAVTETNFTDIASKVAESQIPQTGFVTAANQYVYFVIPKKLFLSSLTDANGTAVAYDYTDAYEYQIYKTKTKYSGKLNYGIAETIYYWYVGTTYPTDPTNVAQNTGVNKWTKLTSTPTQIHVGSDPEIGTWYIAFPREYGFQPYDSTGGAADGATYTKTQITIGNVEYDLFTSNNQMISVNAYFKP